MSFQEHQARYKRLYRENAAWQLLRADNAPHVLAFVATLFDGESDIPFGRARATLDAELLASRERGDWDTEVNATNYLRQWIQAGWLRELDDRLTLTDAANTALQLVQSLDRRESRATASHLRIVQDAVRDLSLALNPNAAERLRALRAQRQRLDAQIKALQAGVVEELPEQDAIERLRELYQLASVLTDDFRRVEDEIRQLDQNLRVQMIESAHSRGTVIEALLQEEELLASTDAGRAFNGFFLLLSDPERNTELREQLRSILSRPVAEKLKPHQQRYLGQLMRELGRESERVFRVRRRTEESLRGYVERGSWQEGRAIDTLLGQLEQAAVELNGGGIKASAKLSLTLSTGNVKAYTPMAWRPFLPSARVNTEGLTSAQPAHTPSDETLRAMQSVRVLRIAHQLRDRLSTSGPQTLAELAQQQPIEQGLEELVAYVRVAQSIGATRLPGEEDITFDSVDGCRRRARVPAYLLQFEQFPARLEDLNL